MKFYVGTLLIDIDLVNLLNGHCLAVSIDGKVGANQQLNLYIDIAPKSEKKFIIRGEVKEVQNEEESTNS